MDMTSEPTGQDLVTSARRLATLAHAKEFDKAQTPQPYITHPARVARRLDYPPELVAVAWLHDVIEDCGVTPDDLRMWGFPESVVGGVIAMTKLESDGAEDAIRRACADPITLVVKSADVADNADPQRLSQVPEPKRTELRDKYVGYRTILTEHDAPTMPTTVALTPSDLVQLGLD